MADWETTIGSWFVFSLCRSQIPEFENIHFPIVLRHVDRTLLSRCMDLIADALGRRYLRFFRFIDAFDNAMSSFQKKSGLEALLEIGKHVTLGIYLGLESSTIVSHHII
jgi:hypothetical protein